MAKRYWLMKVEPEAYSVDDFEADGETSWEGVRNYQARNFLRDDIKKGDGVLFYQSNAEPTGVIAIAEVSKSGYPDHFALDKKHKYYDPKSEGKPEPTWYMVDIKFKKRFKDVVSLAELKQAAGLEEMLVIRRGQRLSIQPVTKDEFGIVKNLGEAKKKPAAGNTTPAQKKGANAKAKARNHARKKKARQK
jgi:predicted RNA-binding protein with PUA-like domain